MKQFIQLTFVGLILFVAFLIGSKWKLPTNKINHNQIVAPTIDLTPKPKTESKVVLKRKIGDHESPIYIFSGKDSNNVIPWKNYLIINVNYADIIAIHLPSGRVETIYSGSKKSSSSNDGDTLLSLQIAGDKLFYSTGTFMKPGATFMLDNPESLPRKIHSSIAGRMEFINNRFLFSGGVGDGCGGYNDTYTFDPVSLQMTKIGRFAVGCSEGEQRKGIDLRNRIIVAGTSFFTTTPNDPYTQNYHFTYVYATAMDDTAIKDGLIDRQSMPENIMDIYYENESDVLWLISTSKVFRYSLTQKLLEEIIDLPKEWKFYKITDIKNNMLCAVDQMHANGQKGALNMSTGVIEEGFDDCAYFSDLTTQFRDIKTISLPSDYSVVDEIFESDYKTFSPDRAVTSIWKEYIFDEKNDIDQKAKDLGFIVSPFSIRYPTYLKVSRRPSHIIQDQGRISVSLGFFLDFDVPIETCTPNNACPGFQMDFIFSKPVGQNLEKDEIVKYSNHLINKISRGILNGIQVQFAYPPDYFESKGAYPETALFAPGDSARLEVRSGEYSCTGKICETLRDDVIEILKSIRFTHN